MVGEELQGCYKIATVGEGFRVHGQRRSHDAQWRCGTREAGGK